LRLRDCPDSDIAMAIAWRRLFTFPRRPRPAFSRPRLYSRMTRFTLPRFARLDLAMVYNHQLRIAVRESTFLRN